MSAGLTQQLVVALLRVKNVYMVLEVDNMKCCVGENVVPRSFISNVRNFVLSEFIAFHDTTRCVQVGRKIVGWTGKAFDNNAHRGSI